MDLKARSVPKFEPLPKGVQPPIMMDEFGECEEAAKKSPAFREALRKRGVEDMSLVMVDAWSAGHYGNEPAGDRGRRLVRALTWVKSDARDNGYAHPIEGLITVIDLNRKEVVRIEDLGVVPVPSGAGNWGRADVSHPRTDLKPLQVTQADGPSFSVAGQEVRWQKWAFRVGFNPREGLVLHTVGYDGRPVLYRGSIAEMIVPYGDPKESAYRKNVFDLGEYGVGMLANSLALGCDCLGTIRYFDGHLADNQGRVVTIKNAVCLHEEDSGMLWKHTDWRSGQSEVRRSRRLAVSMIANVGNYDYGFYWYFYQDGSIQVEVKLTGIVNTQALKPGEAAKHGTEVAPRLNAPYHQHFFNARLDLDIDGEANTAQEVNVRSTPAGPENPHGNAFHAEVTPLVKELAARRDTNPASARFWRVVNPSKKNELGGAVGYRLCPGENVLPHAQPAFAAARAGGVPDAQLLGDGLQGRRALSRRRIPEPEPGRHGARRLDEGRPRPCVDRRGRLVQLRPDARPANRGLAGDAGDLGRLHAQARRLLQLQPRARRPAAAAVIATGTTGHTFDPWSSPRRAGSSRRLGPQPADSKNEESS